MTLASFTLLAAIGQISGSAAAPTPSMAPRAPAALRDGDWIGIVAPASTLDDGSVERACEYLQSRGYRLKVSRGYREADGYLASSDATRAAELNAMFADPDIRAILCLRGGYGSPRLLDRLDYRTIAENPKIFVGYSDISALLTAVSQRSGVVTFHGPMLKDIALSGGFSSFTGRWFWGALEGHSPELYAKWGDGSYRGDPLRTLVPGRARGRLVGGNLSVVVSLVGTPYAPETRGAILFLEDIKEEPFRIDRMLNQLRLSGALGEVKGVLLGQFTDCDGAGSNTRPLETIFREYFGGLGVPVLMNYPAGHVTDQATLPIGATVELDADGQALSIEAPVTKPPTP